MRKGRPTVPVRPPATMSTAGRCTVISDCIVDDTMPSARRTSTSVARGLPRNSTGGTSRYSGMTSRVISLTNVDLPDPLGPRMAMFSPSAISRWSTWRMMRPARRTDASVSFRNGTSVSAETPVSVSGFGDSLMQGTSSDERLYGMCNGNRRIRRSPYANLSWCSPRKNSTRRSRRCSHWSWRRSWRSSWTWSSQR